MDCRTLRLAALGFALGSWGCSQSPTLPLAQTDPAASALVQQQGTREAKREAEGPQRQPKPATCVALAVLREQTASTMSSSAERTSVLEEARRAYQHALKLDPRFLPAYKGLARLYETVEDHDRAMETYRRAVQLHPRDAELWYLIGMCHARHKEWQPTLEAMQKAVELDPENRRYANDFGLCLARTERYQDAFNILKRCGGEANAHYSLARMLDHLGQVEPSKEHARRALQLKPDMDGAMQLLARLENPATESAPGDPAQSTPSSSGVLPVGYQRPAGSER